MENGGWRIEDGRKGIFKLFREMNYPGLQAGVSGSKISRALAQKQGIKFFNIP
jgi:hypothetical protein